MNEAERRNWGSIEDLVVEGQRPQPHRLIVPAAITNLRRQKALDSDH